MSVIVVVVVSTPATATAATAVAAMSVIVVIMVRASAATAATTVGVIIVVTAAPGTPATGGSMIAASVVFAVERGTGADGCVVQDNRTNGVDVGRGDVTQTRCSERSFRITDELFSCIRIIEQAHQELHELLCECRHWSAPSNSVVCGWPGAFAGLEFNVLPGRGSGHREWSPYPVTHR
jgi:hypothetical protein